MDRFAYTALSGMRSALASQDVIAHNIANASTLGFRKDIGTTQQRALTGGNFDDRIMAAEVQMRAQMAPGDMVTTDKPLDISMVGEAMLAVQSPEGVEGYTRRGDLRVDRAGLLVNGEGRPVIGAGGVITVPPAEKIEIAADGTINIQPPGAGPNEMVAIDKLKLVTPDITKIAKGLDGLFRSTVPGAVVNADNDARLIAGTLEGSNVNPMGEMIELMEQARTYELQVRLLDSSKELDTNSTQLLRLEN